MQNLSENEFNQIEFNQMNLIISLLKSKQSIAKLFNNNLGDDKTSDIRRILNRLYYPKDIERKLKESFMK